MARITVEDCLTQQTNRFGLVLLAAKRAKQLLGGAKQVIEDNRGNKSIVTALREIADGQVRFMSEQEVVAHKEEQKAKAEEQRASSTSSTSSTGSALPSGLRLGARLTDGGESDESGEDKGDDEGSRNGSSVPVV